MSNTIQIKHGDGVPNGKLQPYELGYSDTDSKIYMGGQLKEGQLGDAIPLTSLSIQTKTATFSTTSLTFSFDSIVKAAIVVVYQKTGSSFRFGFWEPSVSGRVQTLSEDDALNGFSTTLGVVFQDNELTLTKNDTNSFFCSVTAFF